VLSVLGRYHVPGPFQPATFKIAKIALQIPYSKMIAPCI
jgi:hypothetical protein